jgi:hypothetical protein
MRKIFVDNRCQESMVAPSPATKRHHAMQDTITLAGIEFRPSEIRAHWNSGARAIAKGRKLFLVQERGDGFIAREIHRERGALPLAARGRFHLLTPDAANNLIGFELILSH